MSDSTDAPDTLLRDFVPEDLSAARDLWGRCEGLGAGRYDDDASWLRFLERNPGLSYAAVRDGRMVGTVLGGTDGRRGLIYRLAVDPDVRRSGLARRLVDRYLESLGQLGIDRVLVFLFDDNVDGRRFWRAIGAVEHAEIGFYTLDRDG
ncbi:MAG: GNAT family N-acetyltransferase [Planctomycetota bacterium]